MQIEINFFTKASDCGCYLVGENGTVVSIKNGKHGLTFRKIRKVKTFTNGRGYLKVQFSEQGRRYNRYVHRLVSESFVGESSDEASHVDHLDCDLNNNHKSNLEWVSQQENNRRQWERLKHGFKVN